MTRPQHLSSWLRAIQRYRGYISVADFASVLRDDDDCLSESDSNESDRKNTRVCVGLTCALSRAEDFYQSLVDAGFISDNAITRETCAGRCWRAPVIVHDGQVHPAPTDDVLSGEEEEFELYCSSGGYGVLKSCLARRRSLDSLITSLSSSSVGLFENAKSPLGIRITELRRQNTSKKLLLLIDEDRPGEMAQSFFLSRFPHRVLEGLLIVSYVLQSFEIVLHYTRRHESLSLKFHEQFLSLRDRGLGSNVQFIPIDADGQSEQRSLRQICFASNSKDSAVSALIVDPEFLAWIPEIVAMGDVHHGEATNGNPALYALVGCVSRPGIYKAPVFSTVHDLIKLAGGIKAGEVLHSFVPGDWDHLALPAHHSNLCVDAEILARRDRMTFPIVFISKSDNLRRQTAFPRVSR